MHTSLLTKYESINASDLAALADILSPACISLIPSIVGLWQNEENKSFLTYNDKFALGKVYPPDEEPIWLLNTRKLLDEADLEEAVRIVRDNDHSATEIRFIPTDALAGIQKEYSPFHFTDEDSEYSDYIYNLESLRDCEGGKYEDIRREVRRFFTIYGEHAKIQVFEGWDAIRLFKDKAYDLFEDWTHLHTDGSLNYAHEKKAFERLFEDDLKNIFGELLLVALTYKEKVVAISINEKLDNNSALNHFFKANLNLSGISYYMFYSCAVLFTQKGLDTLNFQDDCGLEGLKAFKLKMRPESITKLSALRF
jgi:hypothetical protein